jgi:DNA replication protein DnaC
MRRPSETPQLLLVHHLKALKLPTFLREYDKLAQQCATEGVDHPRYLLRLAELELIERERRMIERRIKEARFPTVKSLVSTSPRSLRSTRHWFWSSPAVNTSRAARTSSRSATVAPARRTSLSDWGWRPARRDCRSASPPPPPWFTELIEARDEKRLLRLQRQLATYKLLIIDELGYVPLSTAGAELLFEVFSQRCERGPTIVTSNLPFDEWTGVFGSERLTGALLDRLTHHVHILEMNGDSYRLKQSKQRQRRT